MNIKNEILELLKESLKELNFEFNGEISLDHPQDLKNGDFTTNIAMQIAGGVGKNPREIAKQFHATLSQNLPENIEKVEIAGNGYLNFYLSRKFFQTFLKNFENKNFATKSFKQKILLEHSSTNLFKPFHVGHLVNNSIGESLNRILKYQGNEVSQVSFPSDVSPGIAKTIWDLKKENINIETLNLEDIANAYVSGTIKYKEDKDIKKEIDEINIEIYEYLNGSEKDSENIDFYKVGKKLSLKHFEKIIEKLGSKFDYTFFESEAEKDGKILVEKNIGKIFQKSEGAIIFEGKNITNVFINSAGFGTYLTKDIGLLEMKKNKFLEIEKSLVLTDIEQKQHFELIKEAGSQISEISSFVQKTIYLHHGRMNFSGNIKISSRYGNVPLATEVIKKVQENILKKMEDRNFSENEKKEISEKLAIATLKYSILKVTSGKNISFDLEKDLNPQGNTAVFLLYSLVRANSIFRKIEKISNEDLDINKENEISNLEKMLYRFDENVQKSEKDYSPHHLANYLYELSKEFNSFYNSTKILDQKNNNFNYNFILMSVFMKIMKKGLKLLAIESVEKM